MDKGEVESGGCGGEREEVGEKWLLREDEEKKSEKEGREQYDKQLKVLRNQVI